jgi:hypothetical protein
MEKQVRGNVCYFDTRQITAGQEKTNSASEPKQVYQLAAHSHDEDCTIHIVDVMMEPETNHSLRRT